MKATIRIFLAILVMLISSTGAWAQEKTAYAVLTDELDGSGNPGTDGKKETLRFKYEVHTVSGENEWDVSDMGTSTPGWYNQCSNITKVVFESSFADARPKSCYDWFCNCTKLTSIQDLKYLNTSEVTDMREMFFNCTSLTSLDVSHFNTSKVTNMVSMFYCCNSLTSLDVSSFDTRNVTNMSNMFEGCKLTSLDLSNFNTSKVEYMSGMFSSCSGLTSLDVSSFNTSKVTNMNNMFGGCQVTSLDLSNFDTGEVTDMSHMFEGCQVTSLDVSSFNTSKVTNMNYMFSMFSSPTNLTSLTIGSGFTVGSGTEVNGMFQGCNKLADGTLKVTGTTAPSIGQDIFTDVFTSGTLMTDIDLGITQGTDYKYTWYGGKFSSYGPGTAYAVLTGEGDDMTLTFKYGVHTIGANEWDVSNTGTSNPGWHDEAANITYVLFLQSFEDARPESCYKWFDGCENLTHIDYLKYLQTSDVTNMSSMFSGCSKQNYLDLSTFNTSDVTDMSSMFSGCNNLAYLDLSNFDTGDVTNMSQMFNGCENLTSLDLSSFGTANVTNMRSMFNGCSNLMHITIGEGFTVNSETTTTEATLTEDMFSGCNALADGTLRIIGTSAPSIAQDIFGTSTGVTTGVFTNGSLIPYIDIDVEGPDASGKYSWKGGTFRAVGVPYAVLTPNEDGANTKTLTFKFEKDHAVDPNSTTEWDASNTGGGPGWFRGFEEAKEITKVVFEKSFEDARPVSCYQWFYCFPNLTKITGIEYLNTSEVITMRCMFEGCEKLTNLDVSHFNTSKVSDMSIMFCGCEKLESLDLSSFNTSSVTDMYAMFSGCSSLQSLDVSSFNTCKVTDMSSMFSGCSSLQSLDLSSFNTSSVTSMYSMFSDCIKLESLTIGEGFTVGSTTSTTYMFYQTENSPNNLLTKLSTGKLKLKGSTPPSIEQDIFSVYNYWTGNTKLILDTSYDFSALGIDPESDGGVHWHGGSFYYGKTVEYLDKEGETKKEDALYINQTTNKLLGGWYYADGTVTNHNEVALTDNSNIILCDGAKLTINTKTNNACGIKQYLGDYTLSIYGNSTSEGSMGQLVISTDDDKEAIYCDKVNIYGGKVETGCKYGIYAVKDVVISKGIVNAIGIDGGIYAGGDVTINGGQVTAKGSDGKDGIHAGGNIMLGYTTLDDFILASSYNCTSGNVKTIAGKIFRAEGAEPLIGSKAGTTITDLTTINNKKLAPAMGLNLKNTLANITMKFFDGGTTEPDPDSFDPTKYPDDKIITNIDNSGDPADKNRYVIVHIQPDNNYWTDENILFSMEPGAALTRRRSPGIDLGNKLHLLKRDTYTHYSNVKEKYDGAGWFYYELPRGHNISEGYGASIIDGFVVKKFDLNDTNKANISQSGNVVTVTDGTANGWSAELTYDKLHWTFDGNTDHPETTKITVKKEGTELITVTDATTIDNQIENYCQGTIFELGERSIGIMDAIYFCWFNGNDFTMKYSVDIPLTVADDNATKGTETNPWLIRDAKDLSMLAKCVNWAHYSFDEEYLLQTTDIDMSVADGADFYPIGTGIPYGGSTYFSGNYNGNGKTISNLNYSFDVGGLGGFPLPDGVYSYIGLFGQVDKGYYDTTVGTVQNVVLSDCSFGYTDDYKNCYTGGIAAYLKNGVVKNCKVINSSISTFTDYGVGAIVGVNEGGTLTDNVYTYDVNVTQKAGSTEPVTAKGYTKRGIGGTGSDLTDVAGAMLYVKKATVPAANINGSIVTFTQTTKGVNRYDNGDDDFYYAVGQPVTLDVTLGNRTETTDIRTFYDELASITMNGTDITDTKTFTMPDNDVEAVVSVTFTESKWFTIPGQGRDWMTFFQSWDMKDDTDADVGGQYEVEAYLSGQPIKLKTITNINSKTGEVTVEDINGCYKNVPILVYYESDPHIADDNMPTLKFTPKTSITANKRADYRFKGTATDLTKEEVDALGDIYVMNKQGHFILAYDHTGGLAAHRCYINLEEPSSLARLMIVDGDEATEVNEVNGVNEGDWYTLDGKKLDIKPTMKGIYINGNRKVVIK